MSGAAGAADLRIGVLRLDVDPRYDADMAYARIELRPTGDVEAAVRMALSDMKIVTDARGLDVVLSSASVSRTELDGAAQAMVADGVTHLVLDLPAEDIDHLAAALADTPVTLLNTTAPDDWLRRKCHPNLLHTASSDRMSVDALIQHAVANNWKSFLVLRGKTERDALRADAFVEAVARFRLRVVDDRTFDLSTNPAMREQNNISLLTGGTRDYDAVFIADEVGEFARYVPYQTARSRPVVGATGLVPLEWHWAFERYGAPQVNSRFESQSEGGRRMGWQDWSAWIATRAVLTSHAKARGDTLEDVNAFLRSERLRLDGSKGAQMSFRPWNGQLRMPILLATHNAVIGVAPLDGFEHRVNSLDSLGYDEGEFACD
ncbi:hypothetical protein [Mesobacterium pallidum]|uniref:hypothetical protein n=1 Tax=Mesobacterium pallidum TaxID=2872037 RepID=UPI001EE30E1D|nr:hypothetical protein [Mesobacterium pallidum]